MPVRRTRLKSDELRSRYLRFIHGSRSSSWFRCSRIQPQPRELCRYNLPRIPIRLLDVIVHAWRKFMPTFCPSTLEYITTTAGFHARPEAVHPHSTTFLWLIGSLWHSMYPILLWFLSCYSTCFAAMHQGCKSTCTKVKRAHSQRRIIPYRSGPVNR